MNRKIVFLIILFSVGLGAVTLFSSTILSLQGSWNDLDVSSQNNAGKVPDVELPPSSSYIKAKSVEDLVKRSKLIVVGQAAPTTKTINLARDLDDITKPDSKILILGQVYRLDVEQILKGKSSSQIYIVQPEAFLGERTAKTESNIQKARENYKYVPMTSNTKYMFFLEPLLGMTDEAYFTGPAHPWRFAVSENGIARAESPWEGANVVFANQPFSELLDAVNRFVNETP